MKAILRRLAPIAMVATFLGASALPAHAAAWDWQSPVAPNSTYHCSRYTGVATQFGSVAFQECVIVHRSADKSWYQGLLSATYTSARGPAFKEAFSGGQSLYRSGSLVDQGSCGTATGSGYQRKWCFTPTFSTPYGPLLSATGYISYGGVRYEATASASS